MPLEHLNPYREHPYFVGQVDTEEMVDLSGLPDIIPRMTSPESTSHLLASPSNTEFSESDRLEGVPARSFIDF